MPIWGKPADGQASDKTLKATLWAEITPRFAWYGVQPGASISIADAALVTADHLAALRHTWFIPRVPATSSACGRVMAAAVARHH